MNQTGAPCSIRDFIRESNNIERILREPTEEEIEATLFFLTLSKITIPDLEKLVSVYQPGNVLRANKGQDVRIGGYVAPKGGPNITVALNSLLEEYNEKTTVPHELHVSYEMLHPFTDGNGRSGRALWLWSMGGIMRAPLGFLHTFYYQTLQEFQ